MTDTPDRPRWLDYVPLDQLQADDRNPKAHADDDIAASMDRWGYTAPMQIDERTGLLIAGHGRREVLLQLHDAGEDPPDGVMVAGDGTWLAPVVRGWASADDTEAAGYLATDNHLTQKGGWLADPLETLMADVAASDRGLAGTGWADEADVSSFLAGLTVVEPEPEPAAGGGGADDDVDEVPDGTPAVTVRGDVWLLGPHRVMCGDCRQLEDVQHALDGATINVAVTSPPYADRRTYDEASGFRPIPPDEYVEWFEAVQANVAAHLAGDGSWFVNIKAGADGLDTELYVIDLVAAHVRRWGWHWAAEYCWERVGIPGKPFRRFKNQYEPIYQFAMGEWRFRPDAVKVASDSAFVYEPGKGKSLKANQGAQGEEWFGGHDVGSGTAYPGNRLPNFGGSHEATGHAAAFPVALPEWFVRAYSDEGDVVFDPFLGSGSTLIAAHRQGRVAVGMDLSPGYVDITCRRWQQLTGKQPVLEATGEPQDFTAD